MVFIVEQSDDTEKWQLSSNIQQSPEKMVSRKGDVAEKFFPDSARTLEPMFRLTGVIVREILFPQIPSLRLRIAKEAFLRYILSLKE